uniref:Putative reverse transcriptase domain-containing protein n=1 Tax=Tanacetum cinerariifolium TaxID=118510 RepID=A0A6L2LDD9_TANCI|nr:putative reverse transcriptase domain-containing protein [Tanacetum cinerariifolium]
MNVQGCLHKTFMNGKPHPFNGTEGVVGLRRWIEKVEQVFEICKCAEEDKVMFPASTFEGRALTWWNGNVHTLGLVNTNRISWTKYIRGFPKRIKGNITSSRPTTLHDAINMARELVKQAIQGRATRISESNKRKWEDHQRTNINNNPNNNNNNNNNNRNRNRNFNNQLQQKVEFMLGIYQNAISATYIIMDRALHGTSVLREGTSQMKELMGKLMWWLKILSITRMWSRNRIDLLPTRLGSFGVIVGMDWLSYHRDVIVCYEKIVRIPLPNGEILEIQGGRPEKDPRSLSCIKADEKKLNDVRIICDFPEVFLDDLSGIPLVREIEFRIDLIPGMLPVSDKQEEAFCILKERLCNALVLALPDGPNNFVVYCDASNQGFRCVLMQRGKKELNMGQRRWIQLLNYYECEIKYHPGKVNVMADALSRKERLKPRRVRAMSMTIYFGLKTKILEAQGEASKDLKALTEWLRGLETHFERDLYWWPGMKRDIADYVSKCLACSKIKAEHKKPSRLLQQLKILKWKWEKITMDLVTKLPKSSSGYDEIWVIVDRLTKLAHFLLIREDYKMKKQAKIYINEIVARHGVSVSMISDLDGRFASHLWQALQKELGTKLNMSTAYHPQTDGQSERTIQTLKDMLRACVMDFGGSWDTYLPLVEFSYNNSYHTSIKCAPFKSPYGQKCRSPVIWAEVGESQLIGPEIVQETTKKIMQIKLPQELSCVHDVFHVSNVKKCLANSDLQVPLEEIKVDDKLYFVEEPVEIFYRQVKKLKRSWIPIVKVCWDSRRGDEFTWEREDEFKAKYPHLFATSSSVAAAS